MDKLFLFDAYALIYRSYYAFIKNPRINSKGLNTSAIIGFVNTLQEVIEKEHPTHLGVAFDPHGPTFRSEAYPAYKAQREATPEDIRKAIANAGGADVTEMIVSKMLKTQSNEEFIKTVRVGIERPSN